MQKLGFTQTCAGPMRCARYSLFQFSRAGQLFSAPSTSRHMPSLGEEDHMQHCVPSLALKIVRSEMCIPVMMTGLFLAT